MQPIDIVKLLTLLSVSLSPALLFGEELTLHKTLRHPTGAIVKIAFGPDGKKLLSAGALDNVIRLWDVESGEHVTMQASHSVGVRGGIFDVALSPDGTNVASTGVDQRIVLWDVATAKPLREFKRIKMPRSLAFSPDGKLLASGNAGGKTPEQTLTLWDVASGEIEANFEGHETEVFSVAFSPDGKLLASGASDMAEGGSETFKVWDVATRKSVLQARASSVSAVAFSPDGKLVAVGNGVSEVSLWDVASGKGTITFRGHTSVVYCVAFSPDGKWLASGDGRGNLILWDVATGKARMLLKLWEKPGDSVDSVAFSPDGKTLATATSPDGRGQIKLWDLKIAGE
jgi:WD40 repeat protein